MVQRFPPVEDGLVEFAAPVRRVTLLEDRAVVRRVGRGRLTTGRHRLVVHAVSPVVQDVSLQAEAVAGPARVADARAQRAWRILTEDKPEAAAGLEEAIESKVRELVLIERERAQVRRRLERLFGHVAQAVDEIPVDAAWGRVDPDTWSHALETLFGRARSAADNDLSRYHEQEDLKEEVENLIRRRQAIDQLDTRLVGWIGLDVDVDEEADVELAVEYVVPCALWRPVHTARWTKQGKLTVSTEAIVWQNTGEDWSDVELHFSTSRASLGSEPPQLTDDPLEAERKDEHVQVEVRRVEIAEASVDDVHGEGGAGADRTPEPPAVSLPGVDDGGQRRHMAARGHHTAASDGRPVRVPLAAFVAEGDAELVTMPKESPLAVWRVVARHTGDEPLLAGPVELVRDHGPVGWTETRFVAPGANFELGFGPDDAVRVERAVKKKTVDRRTDEWPALRRAVRVYLSNLGVDPKRVKVIEQIPVSEIDDVRVTLEDDDTSPGHAVDDDGFVTWTVELAARANVELGLQWVLETAPGLELDVD